MARVRVVERSVLRHLHEFTILVHDEGYSRGLMSRRLQRASHRNCIATGLGTLLLAATSTTTSSSSVRTVVKEGFTNAPCAVFYRFVLPTGAGKTRVRTPTTIASRRKGSRNLQKREVQQSPRGACTISTDSRTD